MENFLPKVSTMSFSQDSLGKYENLPASIRVLMLGKTGNGKSATANTILGRPHFKRAISFKSCTKTVELSSVNAEGHTLEVMDSPGLFDTRSGMSNDSILLEIAKTAMHFPSGVHVFILVFSCSSRCTGEEMETMNAIEKRFGKKIYEHCLIVFTRSAEFLDAGMTLEKLVRENEYLSNLLFKVSGRAIAVENLTQFEIGNCQSLLWRAIGELVYKNCGKAYVGKLFQKAMEEFVLEEIRQDSLYNIRKMPLRLITNFVLENEVNEVAIKQVTNDEVVNAIKAYKFMFVSNKEITKIVSNYFKENEEDIATISSTHTFNLEKEKALLEEQEKRLENYEALRCSIRSITEENMNAYLSGKSKAQLCKIVSTISMGNVPTDVCTIIFNRLPAEQRPPEGENDVKFNKIIHETLKEKQAVIMNIIGNSSNLFGFLLGDVWEPILSSVRDNLKDLFE